MANDAKETKMEVPNKRAHKSNDGVTFNKDVLTEEKSIVVTINRVTKVVKGGKRMSFNALVVVGNGNGSVGAGVGKSNEVQLAIMKGTEVAKKNMINFPLIETSIPHEIIGNFGAGKVWMKPAVSGTGLIAGGGVRAVLEVGGVKNILTNP